MEKREYLFVGLGNPGKQYEMTRHNMGFLLIKALADHLKLTFQEEKKFAALVAKKELPEKRLHLLLPMTYMNQSGIAVRAYMDYFKLSLEALLVVVDDIALPFGKMRLRAQGSSGGHNGLKSIEEHVKTKYYHRLRIGIGKSQGLGEKEPLADYVLDSFAKEEIVQLAAVMEKGRQALVHLMESSFSNVMNSLN